MSNLKRRIIIYISIFGFLTAIILLNINEIQNMEYGDAGTQQVNDQLQEDVVINPFKYVSVDW